LDLRWLCYHQGLHGGLKQITQRQGIFRPQDLQHVDGELAIRLWSRWQHFHDQSAREELIRYCAADVLLLVALAQDLVGARLDSVEELWSQLPMSPAAGAVTEGALNTSSRDIIGSFGEGSPSRLRGRSRMVG
jgi:hypothetical protein